MGWLRIPLPQGLYVNVYRSSSEGGLGAQVRFSGTEGLALWDELLADRQTIDAEFAAQELPTPLWREGDAPTLSIATPSSEPQDDQAEAAQRRWMSKAANQFVNSLRPRLQRAGREMSA